MFFGVMYRVTPATNIKSPQGGSIFCSPLLRSFLPFFSQKGVMLFHFVVGAFQRRGKSFAAMHSYNNNCSSIFFQIVVF